MEATLQHEETAQFVRIFAAGTSSFSAKNPRGDGVTKKERVVLKLPAGHTCIRIRYSLRTIE